MPEQSKLLTTREACIYLWGEHTRTIQARLLRCNSNGDFKSVRLGGRGQHYWPMAELQKLVRE